MRKNLFNLSVTRNHHQLLMNGLNNFCNCLNASLMKRVVQVSWTLPSMDFQLAPQNSPPSLAHGGLDDICDNGKGLQFLIEEKLSAQRGVKMIPWDLDKQFSSQFLYNFLWA